MEQQKRKRLFVDRAVQGSLAKRIGYHWMFFFGIVVALKILTAWTLDPTASFGEMVNSMFRTNGLFLLVLVLLLPSFIYDSVKLSNRFAGPMVRLKNELKKAADSGEFKEISFREGDFWTDIAESYNSMIRSVNEKIGVPVDESASSDEGDQEENSAENATEKQEELSDVEAS